MFYRWVMKPVLFRFDPEMVHNRISRTGQLFGAFPPARWFFSMCFRVRDSSLEQKLWGLEFKNPLGIAAGYDYEARLTTTMPSVGFGFGSVGTLTYSAYGGNPRPLLGRLPKSRSLMVNKGYKNDGVKATLGRLSKNRFAYPLGVSIGVTNDSRINTQLLAVSDILKGFKEAEVSGVPFSYYELNVSCPNLSTPVDFYNSHHLSELLSALKELNLSRPVFVKMPISKSNEEIIAMVEVIVRFSFIKAVIIGNLQSDRNHPALVKEEVQKFSVGNFSGLPTQKRSDELIRIVFKRFGSRIRIIGCGGVFSADDAYRKIALGASLVQLVTGLIFEGPQIAGDINRRLALRLKREGKASIRELIGSAE